jgi:hypothetical protein
MGARPSSYPRGYHGGEYRNQLLHDCSKRNGRVDLSSLPASNASVTKTHYIVPFTDNPYARHQPSPSLVCVCTQ